MRKTPQKQWHTAGRALAGAVVALAALCTAGCAGDESPKEAVSKAASAVASAGAEISAAASKAADTAASAAAEAQNKLDQIKGGVNAKDAATLGTPSTDSGGYTVVPVTVDNTDSAAKSFAVQVNFKDDSANTVDVAVVTIDDVGAKAKGQGTARSTHSLSGKITAEVARAVRY
ncbi:hypothetical protein HYE82_24815 [Streptomyces sp. BR123]|uniref:hypothetical protein n=1 Tax=Streptomyces sp. BR123 TaxID=2749828 RepID=UPI0015C4330D|nr:hypothetical protein [Streptomyces sp. BR123]NXY97538.1 hypothetical protein [Streptomyces sp. BR123]